MTTPPRLITIPFSHYCEKARWALDRAGVAYTERGHLPMLHYLAAGLRRSVPILVTADGPLRDSTAIAAWADAQAPGALLPAAAAARADALALEHDFGAQLGPATRRWSYFHVLPRRDLLPLMWRDVPRWQVWAFRATRPLAVRAITRSLRLDAAGAERSRAKIDAAFEAVASRLADGRPYLTGDAFTVADLAFAALAAPVVLPPELPVALPALETYADAPRAQIAAWRASPAGAFVRALYARDRARTPPPQR